MDTAPRTIAQIRKEQGQASGRVDRVVGLELGDIESGGPIILCVIDVFPKVSFYSFIGYLGLAIGFWVVSSGDFEFDVQMLTYTTLESINE